MRMQSGALVNTDNLALMIMETAIRKVRQSTLDKSRQVMYLSTVRDVVDQVKAHQKLRQEQIEALLKLIYFDRPTNTMGEMRKILREIGYEA